MVSKTESSGVVRQVFRAVVMIAGFGMIVLLLSAGAIVLILGVQEPGIRAKIVSPLVFLWLWSIGAFVGWSWWQGFIYCMPVSLALVDDYWVYRICGIRVFRRPRASVSSLLFLLVRSPNDQATVWYSVRCVDQNGRTGWTLLNVALGVVSRREAKQAVRGGVQAMCSEHGVPSKVVVRKDCVSVW